MKTVNHFLVTKIKVIFRYISLGKLAKNGNIKTQIELSRNSRFSFF